MAILFNVNLNPEEILEIQGLSMKIKSHNIMDTQNDYNNITKQAFNVKTNEYSKFYTQSKQKLLKESFDMLKQEKSPYTPDFIKNTTIISIDDT